MSVTLPVKISSYGWLKDKLTDPVYREYYYNMLKERNQNAKQETKELKKEYNREYMVKYRKSKKEEREAKELT
jgi:hypothetical protein